MSADNHSNDVLTIGDAIKELDEREKEHEETIAILGASDEDNCSYPQGYVDRQALYACLTCFHVNKEKPAGVCLACSITCHADHNLVELYTKRNFRCDCGNSKFDDTCKLSEDKDNLNEKNIYNHNFEGRYCTCDQVYPNEDNENEDDMIQCVVCEDWYHTGHLSGHPPSDYAELTCDTCVRKHKFLCLYTELQAAPVVVLKVSLEEENKDVDVTSSSTPETTAAVKRTFDQISCENDCKILDRKTIADEETKALYWKEGWRLELCRCVKCMTMYIDEKVEFLATDTDSVTCYEKRGKDKVDKWMNEMTDKHLSQMSHVQKIEIAQGFNELKTGITEFMQKMAKTDKVVTKEQVEEFFEDLNKRKRTRLEEGYGIPPDGCR